MIPLKTIVTAGTIVGMAVTGVLFTRPLLISDAPPWAGITRVDGASVRLESKMDTKADALEALILEGQILGMWRARCDAVLSRNMVAARSYDSEMSRMQSRYQTIAGHQFFLGQCI